MSFREGVTGARLQILFKHNGATFVGDLHDSVDAPGLAVGGMWNTPGIVRVEPHGDVRSQTGVGPSLGSGSALNNVDDGLREWHAGRCDARRLPEGKGLKSV